MWYLVVMPVPGKRRDEAYDGTGKAEAHRHQIRVAERGSSRSR